MLNRLILTTAVALSLTSVSSIASFADDLTASSSGHYAGKYQRRYHKRHYGHHHNRNRHTRGHADRFQSDLRGSLTAVNLSNSVEVSGVQQRSYHAEVFPWYALPLQKVSMIKHISDDMVALAESRAQWRAEQGIPEQTEPLKVIAGHSASERVSSVTYMPDTYDEAIDEGAHIVYYND